MIAFNNKAVCIKNCLQIGTSHKQFEGSFLYNRKVLQEKINKQNVKHKENNGKKQINLLLFVQFSRSYSMTFLASRFQNLV